MANKLWDKGFKEDERIDAFTVGNDRELDHELAPYDIMGTMAHITMLQSVGLLSKEDLDRLLPVPLNTNNGSHSVSKAFLILRTASSVHGASP